MIKISQHIQCRKKNGRFVKNSVMQRSIKANGVKSELKKKTDNSSIKNVCKGKRLVDLAVLATNLQECSNCRSLLDLQKTMKETLSGQESTLHIFCKNCQNVNLVPLSKKCKVENKVVSEVNCSTVLGAVHAGFGCNPLNKFLACNNMPKMNFQIYKRYENIIGPIIEDTAKESCLRAAIEEKKLLIKNKEQICTELPPEMVEEVYPSSSADCQLEQKIVENQNCKEVPFQGFSSSNIQNVCQLKKVVLDKSKEVFQENHILNPSPEHIQDPLLNFHLPNQIEESSSKLFSKKVNTCHNNETVNSITGYDMGWSKRGSGRSYDSLNGYGAIIGHCSGKVLDFRTRNRACAKCNLGNSGDHPNCRKNFTGSAKAMEADVGAELINNSKILKEVGMNVAVVIEDEDSSTMAAVRRGTSNTVHKLADKTHLIRNFQKEMYALADKNKELNKAGAIKHIKKCFSYAISQNRGKSKQLADVLRTIPDHLYGSHEICGNWCKRMKELEKENSKEKNSKTQHSNNKKSKQTITLKDPTLYSILKTFFDKYADNSHKFSVAASSQRNECLNNVIAHKLPKNVCLSKTASADVRVSGSVITFNDGESGLLTIRKRITGSPGTHTSVFAKDYDKRRYARSEKNKTLASKTRRHELSKIRESLRKSKELSEGVQYESNCGMNMQSSNMNPTFSKTKFSFEDCSIVYFDLETGGFRSSDEILQIAAKQGDDEFSVYIKPTKKIAPKASEKTGLKSSGGGLFLNDALVKSVPLKEALIEFENFLNISRKPIVLVAHNVHFDAYRIIRAIGYTNMFENFKIIYGFTDSVEIFQTTFPERKRTAGNFQLSSLAKDLLNVDPTEKFHEGLYDVQILQKLIQSINKEQDVVKYLKTFEHYFVELKANDFIRLRLYSLKKVVSDGILKKMAKYELTCEFMKDLLRNKGKDAVILLLTEKNINGKPKITKDKKVLQKITEKLQQDL